MSIFKTYSEKEVKRIRPLVEQINGLEEEISKLNQMDLATKVQSGEIVYIEIEDIQIPLSGENLLVTMQGKVGFAFAGEGDMGVVLDTNLTEELIQEGFLREILSKIQNMRKDKGFEVLDRINIYVSENEKIEKIFKKFEDTIKHDTLSNNINYRVVRETSTEISINGEKIMLDVEIVTK